MFKSIVAAAAVCALSFAVHANDPKDAHKKETTTTTTTTTETGKTDADAAHAEKAPHGKKKAAQKEQPKG